MKNTQTKKQHQKTTQTPEKNQAPQKDRRNTDKTKDIVSPGSGADWAAQKRSK